MKIFLSRTAPDKIFKILVNLKQYINYNILNSEQYSSFRFGHIFKKQISVFKIFENFYFENGTK